MIHFTYLLLLFALFCAADELIDPQSMPLGACSPISSCWHYSSPPDEICPVDTSTCPEDDPSCGKYHSDCYCHLKTGLSCAWACAWWDWMQVEDWFFKLCPDAATVEFSNAPACAAKCVAEKSIDYGCLTKNTNCFCLHGSLFECEQRCGNQDKQKLKRWLMDTCGINDTLATAGVMSGDFTDVSGASADRGPILILRRRRKLKWYEILAITLLIISSVVGMIFWVWMRRARVKSSIRQALPNNAKAE